MIENLEFSILLMISRSKDFYHLGDIAAPIYIRNTSMYI